MEEQYSTQRILALRKLTRAIADLLRDQMRDYLSTLAPLLRPRGVFGDYIKGPTKESVRGAEEAFQELQNLYTTVATSKAYGLPKELKAPIEISSGGLEMNPVEYKHTAQTGSESKTVIVTSPFKWILSYSGYTPAHLKKLLADRNRAEEELRQCVLHHLVINLVMARRSGVAQILEALRLPVTPSSTPEFGELLLTCIASTVPTNLPPDSVVIESTELAGRDVFEEIVDIEGIVNLRDPLRDPLIELARSHNLLQ